MNARTLPIAARKDYPGNGECLGTSDDPAGAPPRLPASPLQAAWRRGQVVQWLSALFAWLLLGGVLYFLIDGRFIASMIGAPLTTEQSRSGAYGFFVSDNTTTASSTTSPSIPRRRRISRCFTGCSVADY